MSVELELKLAAGPSFHVPPLDGLAEGVTAERPEEGRYETAYWDTADLRLARWGCSLRHRSREGWTLKLAPIVSEGMLSRSELEFAGPSTRPPAGALAPVRAYVRRAAVEPVARLSTWRRRVRLSDAEGVLIEVVDDEVTVLDGRRVAARFREVEVELKSERGRFLLDTLLQRLRAAGAAPEEQVPKHVRAIGPRAAQPPEVAPLEVSPEASAGHLVHAAVAGSVSGMLRRDPSVRLGGDPEAVHEMRVATRRLRSHLRTFRALLDLEAAPRLAGDLGWLADALGEVRDLEVLAARLRGEAAELPAADAAMGGKIAALVEGRVDAARGGLLKVLDSDRYLDLVEQLVEFAGAPPLTAEAEQPAREMLPALAGKPWKKLRRAVTEMPDPMAAGDDQLHRVRILAKRARYAAEAAAPIAGKEASRFARAVASVQTVLGEHQDSVGAAAFLRTVAGAARRAFVAGQMHEIERGAQLRARRDFAGIWDAARDRRLRTWIR